MKIAVIDNGGQYAHRIYRTFQDLGAEVIILSNSTPLGELFDFDGLAFSGSGGLVGQGEEEVMGNCGKYMDNFDGPILAMCAGHQLMAAHFGGTAMAAETPEFGKTEINVRIKEDIFENIPEHGDSMIVWNSHNDEIGVLSEQLEAMADSKDCKYEAIRHKSKPIYGIQFHPEVQHTEYGEKIFDNFLRIVEKYKAQKVAQS